MAATLPPLAQMSLITTWVETLIYGINVVLFSTCVYVLVRRPDVHWVLLSSTVFLFAMSTVHVGMSLAQLLHAFLDPAIVLEPHGADLYFADSTVPLNSAKIFIYVVNVFAQDLLLIWRMYVVWNRNWKLCIVPLILEVVHITGALLTTIDWIKTNQMFLPVVRAWALVGWSLDLVVNGGVTCAIAYRLLRAHRQRMGMFPNKSGYTAAMFTVIESGAIFAAATVVLFVLYAAGNLGAIIGINTVTQLATTTPLLIIVRVGLGISHGSSNQSLRTTTLSISRATRPIEVDITRTAETARDHSATQLASFRENGKAFRELEEGQQSF